MKSEEYEIPAPPTQCDRDDCMEIAGEMGLTPEQAAETYEAVRTDYGAPWEDPNLILVPKDLEPEDLVASAAQSLGFVEAKGMPKVKLKGRSHWADGIRSFLGMPNRTPAAKALASELKAMRRAQEASMADQVKTKDRLEGRPQGSVRAVGSRSSALRAGLGDRPRGHRGPRRDRPGGRPRGRALGHRREAPGAEGRDPDRSGRARRGRRRRGARRPRRSDRGGARRARDRPPADLECARRNRDSSPAKRASQPLPIASGRRFSGTKAAAGEHFESFTGLPVSQAERAAVWASQGVQRLGAK